VLCNGEYWLRSTVAWHWTVKLDLVDKYNRAADNYANPVLLLLLHQLEKNANSRSRRMTMKRKRRFDALVAALDSSSESDVTDSDESSAKRWRAIEEEQKKLDAAFVAPDSPVSAAYSSSSDFDYGNLFDAEARLPVALAEAAQAAVQNEDTLSGFELFDDKVLPVCPFIDLEATEASASEDEADNSTEGDDATEDDESQELDNDDTAAVQ